MRHSRVLAAVVLATALTGCGVRSPSRGDIVGAWVSDKGGTLVFTPDGKVRGIGLPRDYLFASPGLFAGDPAHLPAAKIRPGDPTVRRVDVNGTWRLTAQPYHREPMTLWWDVALDFGPISGSRATGFGEILHFTDQGGQPSMDFWEGGDMEDWIEYHRQ